MATAPVATEFDVLDDKLERLNANKQKWVDRDLDTKIAMARRLMERSAAVGERQIEAATKAKGIAAGSPQAGEEWLAGPMATVRNLRLLIETLEAISATGRPPLEREAVGRRANGKVAVKVFPKTTWDKLMYQGFEAEVWQQEGVNRDNLYEHMAEAYRQPPEPKVALVLGAGNVASIGPLDCVYKLYNEGQVCLLKMNPVNDYLGPFVEEAFAEFIEAGFVEVCYGGAEVGKYLTAHDRVDEIHITGSDKTHDAIVWGVGEEAERRRAEDDPRIDKRITSELGNVSPVVVVPGNWSRKDIAFQAENIASQLVNNAGFNCNAARVVVTHQGWEQREELLAEIEKVLAEIGPRCAYYPGAEDRFERFVEAHPDKATTIGQPTAERLPYAFIKGLDHQEADNICFTDESWCSVFSETSLPGADAAEFLENAVRFCNETLWGTLNACIIIDPQTQRKITPTLAQALEDLEYGSVVINHWPALSYALGATTWGAYPGHTYEDIQSGIGVVHNTFMFDRPEKSVISGPFHVKPKPPWFATNQMTHKIGPKLVEFELKPSVFRLMKVLWPAIRG